MKKIFVFVIIIPFLWACSSKDEHQLPENVQHIMELAGDNASEMQKTIDHYQGEEDSLKLKAAYFLIGNMDKKHCYSLRELTDTAGNKLEFNIFDFKNFNAILDHFDSLDATIGGYEYSSVKFYDFDTITGDFLIKNIDLAFESWQNKPWAQHLDFDQFCEYILPYRGSNEPLDDWRAFFIDKYKWIEDSMQDKTDPIEAARLINNDIMTWFRFDERFYEHPTDQSFSEMIKGGCGRCEDMTNLAIFAMRANGIATVSDYTPYWANTGNNHAWNAMLDKDGKVVVFMGAEANPGDYKLSNIFAKIYRKTFSKQENTLDELAKEDAILPPYINHSYYKDVTAEYGETHSFTYDLKEKKNTINFAYICVFNTGKWCPIDWAKKNDKNQFVFHNLGGDIAYILAEYVEKDSIKTISDPFILKGEEVEFLGGDDVTKTNFVIYENTKRTRILSSDNIGKSGLAKDQYHLLYWKNGKWTLFGNYEVQNNETIELENAPINGLFWLLNSDTRKDERIFQITDNKMIWW